MIRKPNIDDVDQIYHLYRSISLDRSKLHDPGYRARIAKTGFLMGLDDKKHYEEKIQNSPYFLVAEENHQVSGFIIAGHDDPYPNDNNYRSWLHPVWRQLYFDEDQSITVDTLGVSSEHARRGTGTALLHALEKMLLESGIPHLFSRIVLNPITNCASILFHEKNGFSRFIITHPRELFGFPDYASIGFYKKITRETM